MNKSLKIILMLLAAGIALGVVRFLFRDAGEVVSKMVPTDLNIKGIDYIGMISIGALTTFFITMFIKGYGASGRYGRPFYWVHPKDVTKATRIYLMALIALFLYGTIMFFVNIVT